MFKQSNKFLSIKSKKFINEIVLGKNFPYYPQYMHKYNMPGKKQTRFFMCHIVVKRPEDRVKGVFWNSNHYMSFINIINEFCEQQKIKIDSFYRMCVNLSFNNGCERSEIHRDHDFPHHQIIIILNNPQDKNAETVILDNKNKIIKKIKPAQYQGICFDGKSHYVKIPKFGHRVALVATFKKNV